MELLVLCLALALPAANAIGSRTWYFPGGDVTHHFIVNPITLPSTWTLEMWVYPTANEANTWWLSYATPNSGSLFNCMVQTAEDFTNLNTWQHVIMTWDGQNNKIYFDGVEKPIGKHPGYASCLAETGSLTIGQEQDSVGGTFDINQSPSLYLDTIALYSAAWSASEVAAKASNTCVDMSDPNIFAAWYTDDGTDHTGNGHMAGVTSLITTDGLFGYCANTNGPNVGENNGGGAGGLPGGGSCFHGDSTVLLESGVSKKLSDLAVGEVIKTSNGEGRFSFSPVTSLPHARNTEAATFLKLTTETGKAVTMTPDHYIPKCETMTEVMASELVVGDCLLTVDGKETVLEITAKEATGVYTATTTDKYIVVDSVVASPFSKRSFPAPSSSAWDLSNLKHHHQYAVAFLKKHLRGSN